LAAVLVADTDTPITPAAAAALVDAGFAGVVRYVAPDRAPLTLSEVGVIRQAGLHVASVFESSGDSGLGGSMAGSSEARVAAQGHYGAGGPSGAIVWLSAFDFDVPAAQAGLCQSYIGGAATELADAGLRAGFYGPAGLARATSGWDAWWQSESTSFWGNGSPWPGAALCQSVDLATTAAGVPVDGNWAQLPDWGQWDPPAPTPTRPKEDRVQFLAHCPNNPSNPDAVYISDLIFYQWVNSPDVENFKAFLIAAGGGNGTPVAVDNMQKLGVPTDAKTAQVAGQPWPPLSG
jgi:hypothetical protein